MSNFANDIAVTPTITAGAYASGNVIGGVLTLVGVNAGGKAGAALQNIIVVDTSGQAAAMDVLLFNDLPTSTITDKTAAAISAADMSSKCVGNAKITAALYSSAGTPAVASYVAPNLPIYCKPAQTNMTMYAVLVCRGTPTYTSTSNLTVRFFFTE